MLTEKEFLYMTTDFSKTLDISKKWLKENAKRFAFKKLEKDVIKPGICVKCGTCISSCPVDAVAADYSQGTMKPTLVGKCIGCGICYTMCPRTFANQEEIIGEFRSAWKARIVSKGQGQNGGITSELVAHMIEQGFVDGGIVATHDKEKHWRPKATLVTTPEDARASHGTFYSQSPVVGRMLEAFQEGYHALAVVGMSCDIDSIHRMKTHPAGLLRVDMRRDVITLGLFCMKSFDYPGLMAFLVSHDIDPKSVEKMEISKGKFRVFSDEEKSWPLKDLDDVATKSCSFCTDLTAMNADISLGNFGSDDDWTTVLIRSVKAEHVFKSALQSEVIEAEPIDNEAIKFIEKMAKLKMMKKYRD